MATEVNQTAACCAQFYETDWVQTILGESFHPGGIQLTDRLLGSLNIEPGEQLLDVACGLGTTSMFASNKYQANITGVDFSETNVQRANEAASEKGANIQFKTGDAAKLPVEDNSVDHLVCECAVSTFADQPAVVGEFYRVLKSGGSLAISDMVLNGALPEKIEAILAPWTCLASAKNVAGYQRLFLDSGFAVTSYDDESESLLQLIIDLKKKLLVAGLGKTLSTADGVPDMLASLNIGEIKELLDESRRLVKEGVVQYCRITFAKDKPVSKAKPAPLPVSQINSSDCGPNCDC